MISALLILLSEEEETFVRELFFFSSSASSFIDEVFHRLLCKSVGLLPFLRGTGGGTESRRVSPKKKQEARQEALASASSQSSLASFGPNLLARSKEASKKRASFASESQASSQARKKLAGAHELIISFASRAIELCDSVTRAMCFFFSWKDLD